jgi:hypothetical protein
MIDYTADYRCATFVALHRVPTLGGFPTTVGCLSEASVVTYIAHFLTCQCHNPSRLPGEPVSARSDD